MNEFDEFEFLNRPKESSIEIIRKLTDYQGQRSSRFKAPQMKWNWFEIVKFNFLIWKKFLAGRVLDSQ